MDQNLAHASVSAYETWTADSNWDLCYIVGKNYNFRMSLPPPDQETAGNPLEELLSLLELLRPIKRGSKPTKSISGTAYTGELELAKQFLAASNNPKEVVRSGDLLCVTIAPDIWSTPTG